MSGPHSTLPAPGCGSNSAAYVLGALEPAEARAFAEHVRNCAVCRDEVAALAPVIDLLPACVPCHEVSATLRRRVMHAVRLDAKGLAVPRRRPGLPRRTLVRPGIAAALALAVILAVVISIRPGRSPTRVIEASVGHAQLQVSGGHGELIVDHLPPAPPDRIYELWLQRGSGTPAPSTLFAVTARGTAVLGVPGDLTGITRVLVTIEPSGGSPVPTTQAVIVTRA